MNKENKYPKAARHFEAQNNINKRIKSITIKSSFYDTLYNRLEYYHESIFLEIGVNGEDIEFKVERFNFAYVSENHCKELEV